jgi:hypothetical protein
MAEESDVALAVMRIAALQANGITTFYKAKKDIPNLIALSATNLSQSIPRHPEPMWHQLIRNIKSHDKSDGNYIQLGYLEHVPRVGYKITPKGQAFLKKNGY